MTARGFTLADLLAGIDGARVRGDAGVAVAEVRDDSRQVARGDLFIAVPGTVVDGRKFLADAVGRGARRW
jgi:UDP-N-acetylmuramoyl-L-alanyl-D-glutamate--2,6-diaminopimelate ligase